MLLLLFSYALAEGLKLHFIDVGQGDTVLIQSPSGQNALYDGGRRASTALDYLQSIGVESLDLVVASHADADHIAGLIAVVEHYRPRFYMDNGLPHTTQTYANLLQAVERAGSQLLEPTGQRIGLGDVALQVLPPPSIPAWGQNENSVGVVVEYGSFRAALTGDAEHRQFAWWLENYPELLVPVTVYKSSHHGSPNADSELSVSTFSPSVVVIGVGADNPYGHPAPEILQLYESIGAAIYRTDLHGNVVIEAQPDSSFTATTSEPLQPAQQIQLDPPSPPAATPPAMPPATSSCCRVCRTGKPCGDSCIARDRVCDQGPGCACQGSYDSDDRWKHAGLTIETVVGFLSCRLEE